MAKRASQTKKKGPLGVWIIGAGGGLATTLMVGVKMMVRGLTSNNGLITSTDAFKGLEVTPLEDLVFGGHDVRDATVYESAYEIYRENGTIPFEPLQEVKEDLAAIDAEIRTGTAVNCGQTIRGLATTAVRRQRRPLKEIVAAIRHDMEDFRDRNGLRNVIVVNLASTEPMLQIERAHLSLTGLERLIREDARTKVRASTLYAYSALKSGFGFLNFTPSNACILPGHIKLAEKKGLPLMGNDGKTGETLVKTALAPMFKYRNLKILTWQGYNILGDRDGLVLADERNKASKISTKDGVLSGILGYPLHTHVSIDYAPSLADLKTAWDFIHFQGFLDYKMTMQFTWQGCDAILAAPIVIDMIRLSDFAQQRGEAGLMTQLACFFKSPLGVEEHDLHFQFHNLMDYVAGHRKKGRRERL